MRSISRRLAAFGAGIAVVTSSVIAVTASSVNAATITSFTPHPSGCAPVLFVGLRGVAEGPQGTDAYNPARYVVNGTQNWGREIDGVWSGFSSAVAGRVKVDVVNLVFPADAGVDSAGNFDLGRLMSSVAAGAAELAGFLPKQEQLCPNQKIVLAGYSQGAMSVHNALVDFAKSSPGIIGGSHIAAVLLVADPARLPNAAGPNVGTAPSWSWGLNPAMLYGGTAAGCYQWWTPCAFGQSIASLGLPDVPSAVAGKTASLCNAGDVICATDPNHLNDGWFIHIGYPSSALSKLGNWAGGKV